MWLYGSYEAESFETKDERAGGGGKGKGVAYIKHLQNEKHWAKHIRFISSLIKALLYTCRSHRLPF